MLTVCVNAETFVKVRRKREEFYGKYKHRRTQVVRAFVTEKQQED